MLSFFSKRGSSAANNAAKAWAALAQSDPQQLHSLALSSPKADMRLSAVQFVDDQPTLAMVVRRDPEQLIREVALRRITDLDQRISLATDAMLPEELRILALEGLPPDPRLCVIYRPAASETLRKALFTVLDELRDDPFWTRVARLDPNPNTRVMAMSHIQAEQVYVQLYQTEAVPELRSMLTDFTNNPELLLKMMQSQENPAERRRIADRIQDEAVLVKIVGTERSLALCLAVLERISSPALMRQIACSEVPVEVALDALDRVKDDRGLEQVAMHSPHEKVRDEALRRITDEDVLDRLEDNAPWPEVRWLAGRRVGSMPLKALDKITNGKTLQRLIEQEQEPDVASWLVNRVNDQETLRVLSGTSFPGTIAAQRRLKEREGPLGLRFMQVPGRPYEMSIFPVTIAQLREALGPEAGGAGDPRLPATKVTPEEAAKFCEFLTAKGGGLYRLPSYEEWWHACVADDENWLDVQTGQLSWAEALLGTRRLAYGCKGRRPATSAWANPWGLLDMVGNVAVWVDDSPRYWMHLAGDDPLAVGGDHSNESGFAAAAGVCWADGRVKKDRLRRVVARSALSSGWAADKVGIRVVCDRESGKSAARYKVTLLPDIAHGQTKERAILMISSMWSSMADRVSGWYRVAPAVVMASGTYAEARALKLRLESCGAMAKISPA